MRHRVAGRTLSRTSEHRLALRRNMAASLFEHETISTTLPKAKEIRGFAEKLITLAKKGDLHARRRAIGLLGGDRDIFDSEGDVQGSVIGKLFSELGPRYLDRPGGYTRIIKLGMRRLGDAGPIVLLQLVGEEMEPKKASKKKATTAKAPKKQEEVKAEEKAETPAPEEQVEAEPKAEESSPEEETKE